MKIWKTANGDELFSVCAGELSSSLYDAGMFGELPTPGSDPLYFQDVNKAKYKYGNDALGHFLDLYRAGKITRDQLVKAYVDHRDKSVRRWNTTPKSEVRFRENDEFVANRDADKIERKMGPGGQNNFMMASKTLI